VSEPLSPDRAAAPVLEARALRMAYGTAGEPLVVLDGVDLRLAAGERVAIVGASGSGKSTLLHLLGGLDRPTSGEVLWQDRAIDFSRPADLGLLRNRLLGFVYQFHHLLPEFTALENVAMPLRIRRVSREQAEEQARNMLERVGLTARLQHLPGQLSGGERQRVALARALVTAPCCVLADEPTGNLDRTTARQIFGLIDQLSADSGTTFLIVTHDLELAARADRRLALVDGRLRPAAD
jgi:lipoprotein-releasing system ATP-binding protein